MMYFRPLKSPPSNAHIDYSCSHEKPKCHCILYDVPIFPPAARALSLPKSISSAGLESGWQLWKKKKKTVWLHWHSPASLDHIRWKEGNGQLWPSLTLINASESLLDLACGGWTDASLSSPDILGRQADMHRHQTQHTEEKSTLVSISSRDKQQAVLPFLTPHSFPQSFIGVHCISSALGVHCRESHMFLEYFYMCKHAIFDFVWGRLYFRPPTLTSFSHTKG